MRDSSKHVKRGFRPKHDPPLFSEILCTICGINTNKGGGAYEEIKKENSGAGVVFCERGSAIIGKGVPESEYDFIRRLLSSDEFLLRTGGCRVYSGEMRYA